MPSYNRTAVNCPTPLTPSWELAQTSGNPGTAPVSYSLAQGDSATILTKFNVNALRADLHAGYGAPPYSILYGLALTGTASSLVLTVSYGWANIRGHVYRSATTTTVTASGWSAIWLNENASISCEYNSLTPPEDHCVFLGIVTTDSSGITDIDYSGRWTARAGILYRRTADTGFPTDSPGMPVLTETAYGTYYWDGVEHRQHNDAEALYFTSNGVTLGKHLTHSYNTYAGSSTLTLAASSQNIWRISPGVNNLSVTMPSTGTINYGNWFQLWNDHATNSFKVYKSDGTTLIDTVAPSEAIYVYIIVSSGNPTWSGTAVAQSSGGMGGPL